MNFDLTKKTLNYSCERRHRHNLILSLENGLASYISKDGLANVGIPFMGKEICADNFAKNDDKELPIHIVLFLNALQIALRYTTLLDLDMAYYYSDNLYEGTKK